MNLDLLWKIPLFVLAAAWGIYFWSVPSAKHSQNMIKLRRQLNSRPLDHWAPVELSGLTDT